MKSEELKQRILNDNSPALFSLYGDTERAKERFIRAIEKFENIYGSDREVMLFSTPGRSEIIGNHTDHNNGKVIAAAIDRDVIAVAAKNGLGKIRFTSEGYTENVVELDKIGSPESFEKYTSGALIAGVMRAFSDNGIPYGGFDAFACTEVLKGSGLSSSAAFEVMIGNIASHLFGGSVENEELAKFAQYAENEYFGKPCGLMDQMACAVGGFVYIDFEDKNNPFIEKAEFSPTDAGYKLCIVNTGGNHADLNEDYASVPNEMRAVAKILGKEVLRGVTLPEIIEKIPKIRSSVGDRAVLRAVHYVKENERVAHAREALGARDTDAFFGALISSGRSSFEYLQNVYTTKNPTEQGLSLALMLTDAFGGAGSYRVHGGGFAGTVQAFVPNELADEYAGFMDAVFGAGAVMQLSVRHIGACRLA